MLSCGIARSANTISLFVEVQYCHFQELLLDFHLQLCPFTFLWLAFLQLTKPCCLFSLHLDDLLYLLIYCYILVLFLIKLLNLVYFYLVTYYAGCSGAVEIYNMLGFEV